MSTKHHKPRDFLSEVFCDADMMILASNEKEYNEAINKEISNRIKELTISGESLVSILSKKDMPEEIKKIIRQAIDQFNVPQGVINAEIPVTIDEEELERLIIEV